MRTVRRWRQETVIVGAGAGLSTSAGYAYDGARFEKYFGDFARIYRFSDMYYAATSRYTTFLRDHREKRTVFLDLGTGWNTPGIVKFPFKSICFDGDIGDTLHQLF